MINNYMRDGSAVSDKEILKKFPIGSMFIYKSEYGANHLLEVNHIKDGRIYCVSYNNPKKFTSYSYREITPYLLERKLNRILNGSDK